MSTDQPLGANGGPSAAAHMEDRFATLEDASRRLSGDVQALTSTIQVVNDLQSRQAELAEQQSVTEKAVKDQKKEVELRDTRIRHVLRRITVGLAIILPVVAILVYVSLIQHVNNLIDGNNAIAYASCSARNASQLQNAHREDLLAQYETNPKIRAVHVTSARQLRATLSDCSRWKK